jgi:hypothetical protein
MTKKSKPNVVINGKLVDGKFCYRISKLKQKDDGSWIRLMTPLKYKQGYAYSSYSEALELAQGLGDFVRDIYGNPISKEK